MRWSQRDGGVDRGLGLNQLIRPPSSIAAAIANTNANAKAEPDAHSTPDTGANSEADADAGANSAPHADPDTNAGSDGRPDRGAFRRSSKRTPISRGAGGGGRSGLEWASIHRTGFDRP